MADLLRWLDKAERDYHVLDKGTAVKVKKEPLQEHYQQYKVWSYFDQGLLSNYIVIFSFLFKKKNWWYLYQYIFEFLFIDVSVVLLINLLNCIPATIQSCDCTK